MLLDATLVTTGALRIGTGLGTAVSDQPVVRDQRGRPVLPGTSLAGALRAAATRRYGADEAERLFGPLLADGQADPARSAVGVRTAWSLDDRVPPTQLRDHVGIDRERLAARPGIKFDEETWPLGLRFGLRLELADEDLLPALLGTLQELCGPSGGIGSGPCTVALDGDVRARRAVDPQDALAAAEARWGASGAADTGDPVDLPAPAPGQRQLTGIAVDLTLEATVPLACREPLDPFTSDLDNLPFSVLVWEGDGAHRRPAIPGSSLLGVLRQRAEKALAEATGDRIAHPWDEQDQDPRVVATFGTAHGDQARAGAIRVPDAVAPDVRWPAALDALTADTVTELPAVARRQRVKLDRLTHSTLGGAKFDDTVVVDGTRFRCRITVAPPDRSATDEDLCLLAVGLRDLAAGVVGVGGSSRSGYGTVRVVEATVDAGDGPRQLAPSAAGLDWGSDWSERLERAWVRLVAGERYWEDDGE